MVGIQNAILLIKGDHKMVTSNALAPLWDNFHKLAPHIVGYDRVFDTLGRLPDAGVTGFPPYNIRKEGDYNYVIEMALAGFGKKDIEVEVADGTLTVRSTKENADKDDQSMAYQGIAYRKFVRKFTVADDIVVNGGKLENGMLMIDLERVVPEEKKPRLIEVK